MAGRNSCDVRRKREKKTRLTNLQPPTQEKIMLGTSTRTEPTQLVPDAMPRNAASASTIERSGSVTVKVTQRDQAVYLTIAEIAALAEKYL